MATITSKVEAITAINVLKDYFKNNPPADIYPIIGSLHIVAQFVESVHVETNLASSVNENLSLPKRR
jgi:hypothetical protein